MSKVIADITPFTLLDYPDKTACILWFAGCNMRCPYCYNPEIVLGKGKLEFHEIKRFLNNRIRLLDGVVCSGGECTLHRELFDYCHEIKSLGFNIKIDTNGTKPEVIKKLITYDLVDYIALDYKALPEIFRNVTGSNLYKEFKDSLQILLESTVPFEIRTTVHSRLINPHQLEEMAVFLAEMGYKGNFYIQYFTRLQQTLGKPGTSDSFAFKNVCSPPEIQYRFRN